MLDEQQAKTLVHIKGRSRLEQILIVLAIGEDGKTVQSIKSLSLRCGLRAALKWNVSDVLRKSNGYAILAENGWELTPDGRQVVARIANVRLVGAIVKRTIADVRQHLSKIGSPDSRSFIEEAICCLENGQFRAAVIFSWVGAISLMHTYVINNLLPAFNTEAHRRDSKWKNARNNDELGLMKEHEFLNVLEAIGGLGKNVKQTLQSQCLALRNACGHPNSLQISENSVAAHLDILMLNVYSRF